MRFHLICYTFYPSFLADFLIALIGAILGIGGAYWIYYISIRKIREDRLKYIASLIDSVISTANRQSNYCKEHCDTILAEPFSNKQLTSIANRDIKRLADRTDQEGVYHAYLWKYGRTESTYLEFNSLYSSIDYLDYLVDDIINTNQRILEYMWQRKKQYQVTFKKLKELIQALSLDEKAKNERGEFVEYSTKTLKTFLEKMPEQENIVESFKTVVNPVREYIATNVEQHPKVTEIYLLLDDLVAQYYGIELQGRHNAEDYNQYSKDLTAAVEQLESSSQKIRSDFI